MSEIEYNDLLFEISERLEEMNVRERLLFMCRGKLASGSEDRIQDVLSLLKELEERNYLGTDRLGIIKDLLKRVKEWALFGRVKKFESKRKEYVGLVEQIIRVLDELNDLERMISMCRGKISEESEGNISDVRSLFKELENNSCLGIDCLGVVQEILTQTEQNDLLKKVEEFEERRHREDEFERRKGICVSCRYFPTVQFVVHICLHKIAFEHSLSLVTFCPFCFSTSSCFCVICPRSTCRR